MTQEEKKEKEKANLAKLPPKAYVPDFYGGVAAVTAGQQGYYPIAPAFYMGLTPEEAIQKFNELLGVTPAQREALHCGSMFGFHSPCADPDSYDENGIPKKKVGW